MVVVPGDNRRCGNVVGWYDYAAHICVVCYRRACYQVPGYPDNEYFHPDYFCVVFCAEVVGTAAVGKSFGPIMFVWFSMLAILGLSQLGHAPEVLQALSPHYGIKLLVSSPKAFVVLGAVFLCTTGQALYADLGHCGRQNIQVSWIFVKTCLVINYLGQAAWLLQYEGQVIPENPFYGIMPHWFLWPGIIIATMAAIIASQALISGSFTLASEAIRLGVLPKTNGTISVQPERPVVYSLWLFFLWIGCVGAGALVPA